MYYNVENINLIRVKTYFLASLLFLIITSCVVEFNFSFFTRSKNVLAISVLFGVHLLQLKFNLLSIKITFLNSSNPLLFVYNL